MQAQLDKALKLLHDIGGSYFAHRALKSSHLTVPLRESIQKKALTAEQIERMALETWEEIVLELQKMGGRPQ